MPGRNEGLPSAMAQCYPSSRPSTTILPSALLTCSPVNKCLFGEQAYLKAGIGNFISQGLAKRGYSANPRSSCFSPTHTYKALKQELQSYGADSGENLDESEEIFNTSAFEYERHNKDAVFKTASR